MCGIQYYWDIRCLNKLVTHPPRIAVMSQAISDALLGTFGGEFTELQRLSWSIWGDVNRWFLGENLGGSEENFPWFFHDGHGLFFFFCPRVWDPLAMVFRGFQQLDMWMFVPATCRNKTQGSRDPEKRRMAEDFLYPKLNLTGLILNMTPFVGSWVHRFDFPEP